MSARHGISRDFHFGLPNLIQYPKLGPGNCILHSAAIFDPAKQGCRTVRKIQNRELPLLFTAFLRRSRPDRTRFAVSSPSSTRALPPALDPPYHTVAQPPRPHGSRPASSSSSGRD